MMNHQVSEFPNTSAFVDVATRAMELGAIPQIDAGTGQVVLLPSLLPGNWRIGVLVKPQRIAA
jgi:hypothetical protein